jgi:hypothetical protein
MLIFALAVCASARPKVRLIGQADQIVGVNVSLENDISSVAAVSTIGTTVRHELLATKTAAAITSISSLRVNANVINELHSLIKPQERQPSKFRAAGPNGCRLLLLDK